MKYKLIALDVDGTLLNDDHHLSTENKEAIAEVTRLGRSEERRVGKECPV